jgi:predicted AlkP superfamily pyrophosphatase or phosphodiesterase
VKPDFDDFRIGGLHRAANVLGFDGHFAVATIDKDAKRDTLGAAEVEEAVHGGADGASGVEDIIDEDKVHGVHGESDVGGLQNGLRRNFGQVVAIEGDVEGTDGHFDAIDTAHGLRDAFGQRYTAATDADEREIFGAATFFDDLMSEALKGAIDFRSGHKLTFFDDAHGRVILAQVSTGVERRSVIDFRGGSDMRRGYGRAMENSWKRPAALLTGWMLLWTAGAGGQAANTSSAMKKPGVKADLQPSRPKLVVLIVVDQMRADYVDKFRGQWTGGLKRLVEEGAWFRAAAYPYDATETCVGHATISTGAFPQSHGMVANAWWDRAEQKMVTCTSDASVKNIGYAGIGVAGGDSAARMELPSFAEELKFQTGGATRVVAVSLKARAAITMAGHKGDSVTWVDGSTGAWETSSAYGAMPFVEEYARKHPVTEDFGKTWALSLPASSYWYDEKALGAAHVDGWSPGFPHSLRGKEGSGKPDQAFFEQWAVSPFSDTALTRLAESAVDSLGLGKSGGTDFLGVSYSSVDYVGHTFGPRSWEVQDVLVRLDKDLGELLKHLDESVGRGKYVVALSADHGVAPIPVDMAKTGVDAGVLSLPELKNRIEKALETFNYEKPAVARIAGNDIYFSPGTYGKLRQDPAAMRGVLDAVQTMPGVAAVFRAEEVSSGEPNLQEARKAFSYGYFRGRSGDLFVLQMPYWLADSSAEGSKRYLGTGHGTPYYYDQRVPVLLMGYGIRSGEYFERVTPADIAPTLGALCGVTLATQDGKVLGEALVKAGQK